jgi:hypothetical protein
MVICHVEEHLGAVRMREWRRRAFHTLGLLVLVLACTTTGLLLDRSYNPLGTKVFTAIWNGVNMVTTLGDFSDFDEGQKEFMLTAMFATMLVGAFAVTRLTGMLSGDDVMIYRENRAMERKLVDLTDHVVVAGYRAVESWSRRACVRPAEPCLCSPEMLGLRTRQPRTGISSYLEMSAYSTMCSSGPGLSTLAGWW